MADDNIRVPPFKITPPPVPGVPLSDKMPLKPGLAAAVPARKALDQPPGIHQQPKDSVRDIVETIVFVVVLVLLLKTFIAEAFVIPTGSMATTLWGYQKVVECPYCHYTFPLNASNEVEHNKPVLDCTCENCRLKIEFTRAQEGVIDRVDSDDLELRDVKFPKEDKHFKIQKEEAKKEEGKKEKTKITVDGKEVAPGDLQRGMAARVVYKRSTTFATHIDASTTGKAPAGVAVNDPSWYSGDRVLVAKFLYESGLRKPERLDVVVFKFPGITGSSKDEDKGPQRDHVPVNYIKRLIGLPGETIGIYYGDLYVSWRRQAGDKGTPDELRSAEKMHVDKVNQLKADAKRAPGENDAGEFNIIRKNPQQTQAMSRLVYDNAYQAEDRPHRWAATNAGGWLPDDPQKPRTFKHAENQNGLNWLSYHHLVGPNNEKRLITDFIGYNSSADNKSAYESWVGDLILDCTAKVEAPNGELVLALNKGTDRFEAQFNLKEGICELYRSHSDRKERRLLDSAPAPLNHPGEYRLRFANVDRRLTVWVNEELLFGNGKDYPPPSELGPTEADLDPVHVGANRANVAVSKLVLRRDTYYSTNTENGDLNAAPGRNPDKSFFTTLQNQMPARTMFVQPGHYLCLGDNSTASSDSRYWGTVPEALMLGRALVIYFPFQPFSPVNRVGLIK